MQDERRPLNVPASDAKGYELVIDFFSNIGLSREASMYLKMFRENVPWRFAVVLISAESLKLSWRTVALDLAYLSGLSLYPVIVLDNPQGTDGNLVPSQERSRVIRQRDGVQVKRLIRLNDRLISAIYSAKGRAVSIQTQLFDLEAPVTDGPEFDFRRLVKHINLVPIKNAVRNRRIPVIWPLAMDSAGHVLTASAEKVAKALCARIQPQKFIVISEHEGIFDNRGKLVRNIILSTDYHQLLADGGLNEIGQRQLHAAMRLLAVVPDLTLQFATAPNLIHELFTVKGKGTYIRAGHTISMAESYANLDREKLRELIEDGFNRTLVDTYFDDPPHRVFYEQDYHGVIVVKPLEGDTFYLDKFVVGQKWQGEGVGGPLWRELTKYYPKLIWRARSTNPINRWYLEQADGFQRTSQWNIYWLGLTPEEVGRLIPRVSAIPRTIL